MTDTSDNRISTSDVYSQLLGEICQEANITMTSHDNGWIKLLTKSSARRFVIGYNIGLNNSASSAIASSKTATYQILSQADIPAVEHQIFYSPDNHEPYVAERASLARVEDFFHQHHDSIVLKPNSGTTGQRVYHVTQASEIEPAVQSIFGADYWHESADAGAMSPFYEIMHEYRVIMLNGNARLIYQKTVSETSDWKFNLSQGAKAERVGDEILANQLTTIAQAAVQALNLRFCSVDIIKTSSDELLVLEVNSGVSVSGYVNQHPEDYELVKQIFREAVHQLFV